MTVTLVTLKSCLVFLKYILEILAYNLFTVYR
jgi:hypothetical protein